MTVIARPTTPPRAADLPRDVEHLVLDGVSWAFYESFLREIEGRRRLSLTYDRGRLEVMAPSRMHERGKSLLGRMIEQYTLEMGIPIASAGSTTYRREDLERGLEPDGCYYVQREAEARAADDDTITRNLPPDLAIEVETTRRAIDRIPIYAALGVREVWRYDLRRIHVLLLQADGTYATADASACFPKLPLREVERFLDQCGQVDETTLMRRFAEWVRGLPRA